MLKEIQVVMLPTDKKTPEMGMIATTNDNKLQLIKKDLVDIFELHKQFGDFAPVKPYQHLYFLSNEEIKEGDWVLDNQGNITQLNKEETVISNEDLKRGHKWIQKIIATTDESLKISRYSHESQDLMKISVYKDYSLPTCSLSFIEKYIKLYNEGKPIEKVMVEYNTSPVNANGNTVGTSKSYPYEGLISNFTIKESLKLRGNEIIIHPVKDIFNRKELRKIALEAYFEGAQDASNSFTKTSPFLGIDGFEAWFDSNY